MKLSRTQIEVIVVGALLLILILHNMNIPIGNPIEGTVDVEVTDTSVDGTNTSEKDSNNVEKSTNASINMSTKVYAGNGVTFKYPDSWTVTCDKMGDDDMIFVSKSDPNTYLQVQITETPGISERAFEEQGDDSNVLGAYKISNRTIYVDGQKAYLQDHISYVWPFIWDYQVTTITFIKNNKMYSIFLQAPRKEFKKEPFNVIINSLKIQ